LERSVGAPATRQAHRDFGAPAQPKPGLVPVAATAPSADCRSPTLLIASTTHAASPPDPTPTAAHGHRATALTRPGPAPCILALCRRAAWLGNIARVLGRPKRAVAARLTAEGFQRLFSGNSHRPVRCPHLG
jgi:hypothetical protein